MKINMIGRGVAALLLLCSVTAAHAGGYYGGGGVTGGNCAAGQAANGISNVGSPTGCLPVAAAHPGYAAGQWYQGQVPGWSGTLNNSIAPAVGTDYFTLFYVPAARTVTALGLGTPTAGTSNAQLAIYTDDSTSNVLHRPGALVVSTNDIVNTSTGAVTGAVKTATLLQPGWYWFGLTSNDTTLRFKILTNSGGGQMVTVGSTSASEVGGGAASMGVLVANQTYGTWASTFVGSGVTWSTSQSLAPLPILQFQ